MLDRKNFAGALVLALFSTQPAMALPFSDPSVAISFSIGTDPGVDDDGNPNPPTFDEYLFRENYTFNDGLAIYGGQYSSTPTPVVLSQISGSAYIQGISYVSLIYQYAIFAPSVAAADAFAAAGAPTIANGAYSMSINPAGVSGAASAQVAAYQQLYNSSGVSVGGAYLVQAFCGYLNSTCGSFTYESALAPIRLGPTRFGGVISLSASTSIQGSNRFAQAAIDPTISIGADFNNANPGFTVVQFVMSPVVNGVPEPTSWVMMLFGFGVIGAAKRQHRRRLISI